MWIRQARSLQDLQSVWRLTHDMYVAQGYAEPQSNGMLIHYPHLDFIPQTIVWLAEDEAGCVQGSISYTDDGPAGLHVDDDFKDIADQIRSECARNGLRLGASWRIVTGPDCRNTLTVVMGLITSCLNHMKQNNAGVTLYTFNPKHVSFYRRMLDFELIAGERSGHAVRSAPAVLMRGDLSRMLARWQTIATRRSSVKLEFAAV